MRIDTDRTPGTGISNLRVREYARIDRETAEKVTDPRVMAMTRARRPALRTFADRGATGPARPRA